MQSEEFDSKARDAAERHHPAYDENAWGRMEKLLDKHLPQEKEGKRRIALVLLLLLFLSAGGILLLTRPWKNDKLASNKSLVSDAKNEKQSGGDTNASTPAGNNMVEKSISGQVDANENLATNPHKILIPDLSFVDKKIRTKRSDRDLSFTQDIVVNKTGPDQKDQNRIAEKDIANNSKSTIVNEPTNKNQANAAIEKPTVAGNDPPSVLKSDQPLAEPKSETPSSAMALSNEPIVKKKTKPVQRPQSRFFLTLSAGPDVSSVGLGNFGRMLITYGAGVGYKISDKFTLRTGIYSARKLYSASPYDYHPPDQFWQYYTSLRKVNADCRVLEFPLSLSYNIKSNEKRTWFGSLGISSYIMKRESYDYIYKNSWGTMSSWKTTIRNKNEHYFSVLGLSAGYQKRINNTLSFTAEPYLKIPLTGVGYGKVKLASAGILFSIGIHAPKGIKKAK